MEHREVTRPYRVHDLHTWHVGLHTDYSRYGTRLRAGRPWNQGSITSKGKNCSFWKMCNSPLDFTEPTAHWVQVKVKCSHYRPGVAQRVGRGIALLFHGRGTRGGECWAARSGRTLPPGKTLYPIYRRLGGPQGRSGRAENLVPTGIRSRTVQPVVSRYTVWATRHTLLNGYRRNFLGDKAAGA